MNTPLTPEEFVNSFTIGDQSDADITVLADGTIVVVWQSNGQDGSGFGIYGQAFTAQGERIGTEFLVNTTQSGSQGDPEVAATEDGGFVVVWEGPDNSSNGIYAQRFDAALAPVGAEIRVNPDISSDQRDPAVTGLPGGGYVVTWYDEGSGVDFLDDTRAQIFDAAGAPVGAAFTVNTTGALTVTNSENAAVAAIAPSGGANGLADGGFAAVYTVGSNAFLQVFQVDGTPVGAEIPLTGGVSTSQAQPKVTGLAGGGFVVTWQGNGTDIFAQVFEGDGTAVAPAFLVNVEISSTQDQPDVIGTPDGGFTVVWTSNTSGNAGDGSGDGVIARSFDASGTATTGEVIVNEQTSSTQNLPAIAALPDGTLAAVWTSVTSGPAGDGDSNGVFLRLLGDPATFTDPSASPEVEAVSTFRVFDEQVVNAAPQRIDIDGAAALSDADSADFAGGRLILSPLAQSVDEDGFPAQDADAQDQLGLLTGGAISISGADVSVNGTLVGTILSDGQNGAALEIGLNANADAAAVEILIENLSYQNLSDDPRPETVLSLLLEDGDGAASDPVVITLQITPQTDIDGPIRGEVRVNTVTADTQDDSSIATLADGGYISVWTSRNQDNTGDSDFGVFAQRYDANGAVVGNEFQVNSTVTSSQFDAEVAGLTDGGFVIVYDDDTVDSIRLNRYDAAGNLVVDELVVPTNLGSAQFQPDVAALSNGGYVVTWTTSSTAEGDGSSNAVKAQVYNAAGALVGGEILVNEQVTGAQDSARVAALDSGRFVVVWEENDAANGDGSGTSVSARIFDAFGVPEAGEFQVNTFTNSTQSEPQVATLANGEFVVVWRSEGQDGSSGGIYGQRYSSQGVPIEGEFRINDYTPSNENAPQIVGLDTGGFVVAWVADTLVGSGADVIVQVFDADGTRLDGEVLANTGIFSTQDQIALTALPNGNYVVQWTSDTSTDTGDGSGDGVFQQIFGDPAEINASLAPVVQGLADTISVTEAAANGGALLFPSGAASLVDTDSADLEGGQLRILRVVSDLLQDRFQAPDDGTQDSIAFAVGGAVTQSGATLRVNGVDVATIVSDGQNGADLVLDFLAGATLSAVETLLGALTYTNSSDNPRDSRTYSLTIEDGDGGATSPIVFEIDVTQSVDTVGLDPVGPETQVNSFIAGEQTDPEVAVLADGGWVVVWTSSGQDGSSNGVYAQRYAADGAALGNEVEVADTTLNSQSDAVVVGLTGGGYVVVWEGNGPDDTGGVFAKVYDASGAEIGSELRVNTTITSNQFDPAVAATPDGGFVVSYTSDGSTNDGSGSAAVFQRFDAAGVAQGSETVANVETSSTQADSDITVLSDGRILVVWVSATSGSAGDGSSNGVFGAIYTAAGVLDTGEFQINQTTLNAQNAPTVAATPDGGFLVAWEDQSNALDGSGQSILARSFDATATATSDEFVVNDITSSTQSDPSITVLQDGRYVISYTDSGSADGSGLGVFAQLYASDGSRIDGSFQINTEFSSTQNQARLAALPDGGLVAVWQSTTSATAGDGSGSGIFQQIFGLDADFDLASAPRIEGVTGTRTIDEADANAGLVALEADRAIAVGDLDATSFDGGVLTVSIDLTFDFLEQLAGVDGVGQNQFGILAGDVGNGDVQLSGSNVLVDGVVIGTITSDGTGGQPLIVTFNGNSTVESVEAVMGNLGYSTPSDAPASDRRIKIELTDSDGKSAKDQFIDLTVTPEPDSDLVGGVEQRVNAFTQSEQSLPDAAELTGGGHVVVWVSFNQDNLNVEGSAGVFAQVYDAAGVPSGPELLVNSTVADIQEDARVAGTADGGFVVIWEARNVDNPGDFDFGIIGQRFDAGGSPVGGEFVVNSTLQASQFDPDVAAFVDGGFVVTWVGDDGDGSIDAIISQRFDATGSPVGSEVVVNVTATESNQSDPAVATLVDGLGNNAGHAIVFVAPTSGSDGDGSGNGIYLRVFDAAGVATGPDVLVNTTTAGSQFEPDVTGLSGGGFVVTWTDAGADGSSNGVYAQLYNAAGAPVGGEFRVNTDIVNSESDSSVTAMADGGFVVSWTAGSGQDGSGNGVFAQRYDANGVRIDAEVQINSEFFSSQDNSVVVGRADGSLLAVWRSDTNTGAGDGSGSGIFQRSFTATPTTDTSPILSDVARYVSVGSDEATGGNVFLIDDGISLVDPDGGDFDGGVLRVYYTAGDTPNDQLSIVTDAVVTLAGSDVSVGGTVIGTIDGTENGVNGAALSIALNANATADLVARLFEAVGYSFSGTSASLGFTDRGIGFTLTDGAGGQSQPDSVYLDIFAGAPGADITLRDFGQSENEQFTTLGTASESDLLTTPRVLDAAVDLDDTLGIGYANGLVRVQNFSGAQSVDVFSVQDQGTGLGEIGFDGTTVTYEGTAIGTVNGTSTGVNGQALQIDLNANATAESAEALVEALTYGLTGPTGRASQSFGITVQNGAGASGSSQVSAILTMDRDLIETAAASGEDQQVNTFTPQDQSDPAIASLSNGGYVVTWNSQLQDNPNSFNNGIFAQIYNAQGSPVGVEFQVNDISLADQSDPQVTGLPNGTFVITWTDNNAVRDGSSTAVVGQVFSNDGTSVGDSFVVNEEGSSTQYLSQVVALDAGRFMVTWAAFTSGGSGDGSDYGIFARVFAADGTPEAGEFQVNSTTTSRQEVPTAATLANGDVIIAWRDQSGADGNSWGIFAQRVDSTGALVSFDGLTPGADEQQVNTTTAGSQDNPDVAALAPSASLPNGGFVIVWEGPGASSNEIFGQIYDAAGVAVGTEFQVNIGVSGYQGDPQVIGRADGGFSVVWRDDSGVDGSGTGVVGQNFAADGTPDGVAYVVNTEFSSTQWEPDLVELDNGALAVVWAAFTSGTSGDGSSYGVFQKLFDTPPAAPGATDPVLEGFNAQIVLNEQDLNAGLQLLNVDGTLTVADVDSADFDGGEIVADQIIGSGELFDLQLGEDSGFAQDDLGLVAGNGVSVTGTTVRVDGTAVGTITSDGQDGAAFRVALNANATPERVERVVAQLGYANSSDNPDPTREIAVRVSDGDGGSSNQARIQIIIETVTDSTTAPVGDEEQVNTFVPGNQQDAETSAVYDTNGVQIGYVVVWESADQDRVQDNSAGVFAQIYDLDGTPVGTEFQVNETTEFAQSNPYVAGIPTGGFVVGWSDGSTSEAIIRIFDANGVAVTGDLVVNDTAPGTQELRALGAQSDGTLLAVYTDNNSLDGSGVGVFLRILDAGGAPQGASVQVNTEFSSTQNEPSIAVLSDDRFVITWTSAESGTAGDGSSNGIIGQLFSAAGTPVGGEFIVNAVTQGAQQDSSVAPLTDGGFVVVWTDTSGLDGSGWSTQLQRYDATGAPVGGQVRVNETTVSSQYEGEVIGLDTGGWLVVWTDDGSNDGSGLGVFGQLYAADGSRIDGEFQINTEFSSSQSQPVAVALPGGDFAVIWTSFTSSTAGDGSGNGVFQQVFSSGGVAVSEDPVIVGLANAVTLDEADVNAAPQRLVANIGLGDPDSTNFDGGQLIAAMIVNDQVQTQFPGRDGVAQDQLGLDTSGPVSVVGTSVRVDGTEVATLTGDGANGAALVLALGPNATPDAVELLIEALTYANPSDDPEALRTVAVQLTDGDGGSVRETIDITITPETDGGVVVGGEAQTNSFTISTQNDSDVAALSDGGYVIVWTSINQDGTGDNQPGVFLQRYDAAGAPVGGELQVNTTVAFAQQDASVIGLSGGGFVVAWEDTSGALSPNNDQEIILQLFGADGQKLGGEILVDSTDAFDPLDPALAALDTGGFIVVNTARENANSQFKITGQIYDANGGQVGTGFEIPTTGNTIGSPDVATQPNGTFVVVYTETNVDEPGAFDSGVLLQRFAADGSTVGGPILVNTITRSTQNEPSVTALDGGGYVVVYTSFFGDDTSSNSYGVYGQRFDDLGNKVGVEFLINEVVDGFQYEPDVTALPGGGFAVAYRDSNATDGSGDGVFLQQYDGAGQRVDGAVQVNEEFSSTQAQPAIATLPGGNVVVSFTSSTSATAGDGNGDGVFHRIIGDPADFSFGGAPVLEGVNATVTYVENTVNGVPQLIDANGAAAVSDPDSADFDGGSILVSNLISSAPLIDQINAPDNLTQDQLGLRQADGITILGSAVSVNGTQVGTIVQGGQNGTPFELSLNANATAEIVELLVENLTYRNISDDPLETRQLRLQITDGDGGASDSTIVTVQILPTPDAAVPVGGERVVNTSAGTQTNPAIATIPGTEGDFIVVWQNDFAADGSQSGVYAQRFDALGNPLARDGTGLPDGVTDEFLVNTTTTSSQYEPQVAAYADGGWVVVWSDNSGADGSGIGVFLQRFNPDGTPNGTETQVNAFGSSTQFEPDVAVLANGSTVVTFAAFTSVGSGDGSSYGVSARIFDTNGLPTSTEFVVNTETAANQQSPEITALSTGGFVITYRSDTSGTAGDGSSLGVFAQVFDAAGTPVGSEFQVNTTVQSSQYEPQVVELTNGNLVFVWRDDAADLSASGVYAQIYGTNGSAITEEFRVNDQRINSQYEPDIAALDTGGFVITWADNNSTDGSGVGVFAQQYDASGARLDSQVQVNTTTSSTQDQPSVAALPGGGFVIAFNGTASDGEILLQVFGNEAPTISPVSATGDEDTPIVLDAAIFDAGFFDPDGNTLQEIRIETFPDDGILSLNGSPVIAGQIIGRADLLAGNLVYLGAQDFNGTDSFLWSGSDGITFASEVVAATITVDPVNDAPGLEAGADTSVGEGQPLNRTITLSDPDTDTRSFTVDYGDGQVDTFNSSALSQLLSKSYATEGTFTVTVTVDDNAGEANSVEVDSFEVTVLNADPAAGNDTIFVGEDGPAATGNVLSNDSDPGNDPLTVVAINGVAASVGVQITLASGALLTVNADGSYDYDPNGAFEDLASFQNGNDSFTYTVSDGEGGTDQGTVSVIVDGQNDAPDAVDDGFSANDTDPISGNVLDNDTDPDTPDVLSVTSVNGQAADVGTQVTLGSGALLTLNGDGTFDYDPNGAFGSGGFDSFTYAISDGRGGSDSATVTISINSTNRSPVAQDDAITGAEDTASAGDLLADNGNGADADPDGDPITVTQVNGQAANVGVPVTLAGGGRITVNSDGTYSFDPDGAYESLGVGETTDETFTYTIEDGQGGSDQATVTLTISGANDAPTALNDSATTDEDSATSGNVLGNDTDPDNDTLTVSSVGGSELAVGQPVTGSAGGTFTLNGDGSYSYDPAGALEFLDDGESTSDSIGYEIDDGNGGTDTAVLSITVTGVNDAPVAQDDAFDVAEDGSVTGNLRGDNGNGADSDPDASDIGTITAVNGQAASIGTQITLASGALLVVNGSGTFTYDTNGAFVGLQTGETATDSFVYTLTDDNGVSDTATATFTIAGNSSAPVAVADTVSTDEDSATSGAVLANDTDGDGDALSVSAVNGVAGDVGSQILLASGALLTLNGDGTFDYDPNGAFEGLAAGETTTDSFGYTVSDGNGGSDTGTVTVQIDGVNDAPVARPDVIAVSEDASGSDNLFANNGSGVDSDPDGSDTIAVSAVNGAAAAVGSQIALPSGALLTVLADGSVTYDPNGQFEGLALGESANDVFSYTISDGNGGTDTANVTVVVSGENDAPVAADDAFATAVAVLLNGNVLGDNGNGADADPDTSDTLSVVGVNGVPANVGVQITLVSGALLTLNADGSFAYDDNGAFGALGAGASATDSFEYTISDGNGGSDSATATIVIGGDNLPPVATNDTATTDEDTAVAGAVLANDTDPNGDALSVSAVNGVAGDVGSQILLASGALLTLNGDGTFDYDPNGAFEGLAAGETTTDSFGYTVSDGNGGSDTGTVTVQIDGVNDAPVAVADTVSTDEDSATSGAVLANDTDGDGDALSVSAVNGVAGDVGSQILLASGALLTLNGDGTFDYDPNGAFEGLAAGETTTDSFGYTVSDGNGGSDTGTVTVQIDGVNDAPVARPDVIAVSEDASGSDNLFANNGSGVDSDPDGSDTIAVSAVNGAAAAVGSQIALPSGALLTVLADGSVTYDPNGQFEGLALGESANDVFSYTISDGNGGTDTANVTVVVSGENDAPVAADDAFATAVAVLLNGNVLGDNGNGADADPDTSDTLSVVGVNGVPANVGVQITLVSGALLTLNADGSFAYDDNGAFGALGAGASATDSFEYTISDGNGGSDSATATIVIGGDNLPPVATNDTATTDEDTAVAGAVLANDTDPNGDALSVSAVNGVAGDVGSQILLASGALLTLNGDGTFDYDPNGAFEGLAAGETTTDSFGYTVSDGNGGSDTGTVTVQIDGVNDAPVITSADGFSIPENTSAVGTVTATDLDGSDTLEFGIAGGADAALFQIDQTTGALEFVSSPDFETPLDAGADNIYDVAVSVTDGTTTVTQDVVVTVTDEPDTGTNVILGTPNGDSLFGSDADELFRPLGGRIDLMFSGGGADVFEFRDETSNGVREFDFITGFGADDALDLGEASIILEINRPNATFLLLDGDFDVILLLGTPDFDPGSQLL